MVLNNFRLFFIVKAYLSGRYFFSNNTCWNVTNLDRTKCFSHPIVTTCRLKNPFSYICTCDQKLKSTHTKKKRFFSNHNWPFLNKLGGNSLKVSSFFVYARHNFWNAEFPRFLEVILFHFFFGFQVRSVRFVYTQIDSMKLKSIT